MNLILAQNPGITKVGLLYDAGQDSSTAAIADAKAFLDGTGARALRSTDGTGSLSELYHAERM